MSFSRSSDLVEALLDVLEDGAEVVLVELLAALLAQLLEEVAQALHALAHRVAHAALHQVAERVLQVAEVHQVVGQAGEDVIGVERGYVLGAVPLGVLVSEDHSTLLVRPLYATQNAAMEAAHDLASDDEWT